jgi:AraC-like DNA-binding protein/quercetin dioxygenase-like cupin family protein
MELYMDINKKVGYLNSEFKIFHLIDKELKEFSYHYHDFNKLIIFISGNVSYHIEGKSYQLNPYDIVMVNAGEIHRPVIHDTTPYERIVIYISPSFFDDYKKEDYILDYCFTQAFTHHTNVLRIDDGQKNKLLDVVNRLEQSFINEGFANTLYQKILFLEFMITINQVVLDRGVYYLDTSTSNLKVLEIMKYINEHLNEELTIDLIASSFYLNRSYLMHLFKDETGYTIGKYITEKRLFMAKTLIQNGTSVTEACFECGFKNYATFFRAFKEKFNRSPKDATEIF